MALADITLADSKSTPENHVFSYVGTVNNRVIRKNLSSGVDTPETLTIAHNETTKNGSKVDGHLARIDWILLDTDGTPHAQNLRVVGDLSRAVYDQADFEDKVTMLRNLITDVFMVSMAAGSVG
jgi:hypothetical protein